MKRTMLILLFILLTVGWMAAQVGQAGNYIPNFDELGAHNNGGRGCAGCHAPHSGARGNGGTLSPIAKGTSGGGREGDWHLWGQDVSLITQETLSFGGGYDTGGFGYTVNFGGETQWLSSSNPMVSGIASCLSCHDGNISEGAMMTGYSYEGFNALLPAGKGLGAASWVAYGPNIASIPTLLGNDGGAVNDYLNDHPVGNLANFNKLNYPQPLQNYGLTFTPTISTSGTSISVSYTVAGGSPYAQFVTNYGMPAINSMVIDLTTQIPYVVCTTCHNQHQMNIFLSSTATPIAKNTAGTYATYFFVNAPYNPGAPWTPYYAPSTTQFCRECHFGNSNESFGINGVGTAF